MSAHIDGDSDRVAGARWQPWRHGLALAVALLPACELSTFGLGDGGATGLSTTTETAATTSASLSGGSSGSDASTGGSTSASPPTTGMIADECAPTDEHANGVCSPARPYCSTEGDCVTCAEISSCAALDANKPACDETDGVCVQCTAEETSGCVDTTPICDADANTCRACREHTECESRACDIAVGACFPAETALWVDVNGACDEEGPGTEDIPLCNVGQAVVKAMQGVPQAILVHGGIYGGVSVPMYRTVAIVRVGEEPVEIMGSGGFGLIDVPSGARVYLDGLVLRDHTEYSGIYCEDAEMWIDHTLIRGNGSAINNQSCALRVRASVVTANRHEGMYLLSGHVIIENSFITDNGDEMLEPDNCRGGIVVNSGATVELNYTTLVGNHDSMYQGDSINCVGGTPAVSLRNSIAFNKDSYNTFNCNEEEIVSRSAIAQDMDDPNDDNLGVTVDMISFLVMADPGRPGVYRPFVDTELADVALFKVGDPELDFEGDPRPMFEPGYPGADEP